MTGFPKPLRGSGLLERRNKRRERVKAEQAVMHAALVRDKMQCRWPQCEYRARKLPIDPAHLRHRGMGGNPSGDRTASTYDSCEVEIDPLTDRGADGPLAFLRRHPETGTYEQVAAEVIKAESVIRWLLLLMFRRLGWGTCDYDQIWHPHWRSMCKNWRRL